MDELIKNSGHYLIPVLAIGVLVGVTSVFVAPAITKSTKDNVNKVLSNSETAIDNANAAANAK